MTAENLRSILTERASKVAELASLQSLTESTAKTLAELESGWDLRDSKVLNEIIRQRAVLEFLPRRIAARDDALTEFDQVVLLSANKFIGSTLGPLGRALIKKTEAKVRALLQPHFASGVALEAAVGASQTVQEAKELAFVSINNRDPHESFKFAETLLGKFDQIQKSELQLT